MHEKWIRRPIARGLVLAMVVAAASLLPIGPSGAAVAIFDPEPLPVLGSSGRSIPLVGDFAGSAFDDIFGYAPGSAADRLVVSAGDRTASTFGQSVTGNYDALVGDFAGDSHDDIFWYAVNAPRQFPDSIWISKGNGTWVKRSVNILGEYRPFVGDFDGNGHDALFWYAPGSPPDSVWRFTDTGDHVSTSTQVWGSWVPLVGDFADGPDGHVGDDIVWHSSDHGARMWRSTDSGFVNWPADFRPDAVGVVGSFNGDRFDDLLLLSPWPENDAILFGPLNGGFAPVTVRGTYSPVVGDWNGDGDDDVLFDDVVDGPDPVWFGRGDATFDKVGQVDLEPVSSVHRIEVGNIADAGSTDDVLVVAGSEGSPINSFQLYYGIAADT